MNCIVVDDEPLARDGMEMIINDLSYLTLLDKFSNAKSALEYLKNNEVDLMFLDIEMPGLTGLEFLKILEKKPIVILTTAYPQYALEAFELDVLDYLVKPIRFERFYKAVSKAKELLELKSKPSTEIRIEPDADYIFIKADRKLVKLYYADIRYIKGMKDYVLVHSNNGRFMTAMNIKTILGQLPSEIFARVSKSYIINVGLIRSIELDLIDLDGDEIPLGNSYKAEFLKNYINDSVIDRKKKS